jgi:hypothetical protein
MVLSIGDVDPSLAVYGDPLRPTELSRPTTVLAKLIEEEESIGDPASRNELKCAPLTQHTLLAAMALTIHQDDFQRDPLSAVAPDREALQAQLALSLP